MEILLEVVEVVDQERVLCVCLWVGMCVCVCVCELKHK